MLHKKLASLENAGAALVTASGMAAISTTLLALFSPGDHILVQDCLYGGTQDFIVSDFVPLGFQFDFIDVNDPGSWNASLKPDTRGFYAETITNPLLQVGDLKALAIAGYLAGHAAIERVNYPGLPDHPGYHRARVLLEGFGGMVSFELKGGIEAAERFMQRLTIPIVAPSLGGVETLVTRPATTSHAGMSAAERQAAGISDALIRLSVGIEDTRDLIHDFENALPGC